MAALTPPVEGNDRIRAAAEHMRGDTTSSPFLSPSKEAAQLLVSRKEISSNIVHSILFSKAFEALANGRVSPSFVTSFIVSHDPRCSASHKPLAGARSSWDVR